MEEILMDREEKKTYQLEQIQALVEANGGLVKTADILELGIDYRRILQFMEEGLVRRVKNGYYTTTLNSGFSQEELILAMYPEGILTMESALYCYGYLKKQPFEWSIAISKNVSKSRFRVEYPVVKPYYTEPKVLEMGVTEIDFATSDKGSKDEAVHKMKIYTIDRLICDVLKYEEKMDREDFKQALLSYIQDDRKDIGALMEYAKERKVRKKVQTMIGVWL
ncbi:MAG: type IV toxin-antitoxin system AbiEi family antitoxin domain-containing protein [Lachnospiraceae bacterium]|jgi:predicted transcriptional regulator of viral defense system|nr:type IV toxin-antitoxin system AbiEi family antitoxin domain-containing protein [Lachnospiraceae bacterium]SFT52735.1 Transcriptional regulator, AbiEi antitoxin, Type IV TA system [Lachnospiraceae bacterium XBD2001]MBQ2466335.1 type IV toxin-antitoxin system AbiEi family antitoxin domain-containing protein [Lachnospiraceae bacterium]MBQ2578283.1 type IV toxin-antitoxin system AbiEi family antitoxin domain-containing protein [Lachnospiraceae bacterium]MBQ4373073.1 type IV toxin-antitoxin syst